MQTDSGYTLVELLMATAVGAVVVAAAYASYAVVSGYYEKLSDMANLQDTGRQSLYMIVRDIRMAGYEHYAYNKATKTYESEYGSVSESIKITDSGDACCDGIDVTYDLGKCRGAVGRDPATNQEDKAICEKNGGTWDGEVERVKIGYYTLGKCRGAAGKDQATCEKNGGTWTGRLYRSKAVWKKNESKWSTDEKDGAYQDAVVADHIEDFQVQQDVNFVLKWGSSGTGDGEFKYPRGVAVDGSGNVYVTDFDNNRIQKFDSSGKFLDKWGQYGTGDGQFDGPYGVAIDAGGNVYVAEWGVKSKKERIQKFDSSMKFLFVMGDEHGTGDGQFVGAPGRGVAVDGSGNVWVTDNDNHRIQKFDSSGNFLGKWGSKGSGDGQFKNPQGVAIDANGNVYVADYGNHRIQKFDSSMKYLDEWSCDYPQMIAIDGSGNVYESNHSTQRIQKFDSSGNFLLKWGSKGSGDGQFVYPRGVAVDGSGNVYVADRSNHRIQKFNSSTVGISLTVKTRKEHGREKRAYTRRDYNPGNYDIKKNDKFIRDEFSTTVYIRN